MASLKEVKDRIDSIKSTRKITSAMKMIASSKLRKSQQTISSFLPYSIKLNDVLTHLLASGQSVDSAYSEERDVKKIAIVAFSSNTSLCGSFNANVLKELDSVIKEYSQLLGKDNITIYPIGKKVNDYVVKSNYKYEQKEAFNTISDKPSFAPILELSKELVSKFLLKEYDKIILIYTHFQSAAVQIAEHNIYLPFNLKAAENESSESNSSSLEIDYILEPSREHLLEDLIPKVLTSNLYAALLDSNASENAARSLAMQIATDNADELVQDLTIVYNKNRQSAITNELLDIIGGASALQ